MTDNQALDLVRADLDSGDYQSSWYLTVERDEDNETLGVVAVDANHSSNVLYFELDADAFAIVSVD